jgi:hypothetical protein
VPLRVLNAKINNNEGQQAVVVTIEWKQRKDGIKP